MCIYICVYIYIYGGWSKHSCRCVIRNDLAPALALPCALQGFYCVPLHRLKYVFKNWLPQKVAQFKGVFTDPVRCATETFLAVGSKIWWFGARILKSWRFGGALPTAKEIWFPKRPFWARKKLYGNQISRGMVEGECIHIEGFVGFSEVFCAFAMPVLNPSLAQGKRKFLFRLFCQVGQASLQGSGKNILTAP